MNKPLSDLLVGSWVTMIGTPIEDRSARHLFTAEQVASETPVAFCGAGPDSPAARRTFYTGRADYSPWTERCFACRQAAGKGGYIV